MSNGIPVETINEMANEIVGNFDLEDYGLVVGLFQLEDALNERRKRFNQMLEDNDIGLPGLVKEISVLMVERNIMIEMLWIKMKEQAWKINPEEENEDE